jgi:hypothetical protein
VGPTFTNRAWERLEGVLEAQTSEQQEQNSTKKRLVSRNKSWTAGMRAGKRE